MKLEELSEQKCCLLVYAAALELLYSLRVKCSVSDKNFVLRYGLEPVDSSMFQTSATRQSTAYIACNSTLEASMKVHQKYPLPGQCD